VRPGARAQTLQIPIVQGEHPYINACMRFPSEYYDYERFRIDWGSPDPYLLSRKIGRGKYSEVFTATNRVLNLPCVVKMLKPVKEKRLAREVLILQNLCGVPNVISLYDMVLDEETGTPALVFEAVNNTDHKELYPTFTDMDVRFYMYELIRTLDLVHGLGIMHRDVKPQNICIDHKRRKLRLIDWGLAEFYLPDGKWGTQVGSKHYKAPELWMGDGRYDYRVDLWAVGCMLAAIVFRVQTFFRSKDHNEMIERIAKVTGSAAIVEYAASIGTTRGLPKSLREGKAIPKPPLESFLAPSADRRLATPEVLEFLDALFVVDHRKRVTAREALAHPYFDSVRGQFPPPGTYENTPRTLAPGEVAAPAA
jgi:casein kinase II subunit alpha